MYRENAATVEELHSLVVHTTSGGATVGVLTGGSIVTGYAAYMTASVVPFVAGGLVALAAALAGGATITSRRRDRKLVIDRLGSQVRLFVRRTSIELDFPLVMHGSYAIRAQRGRSLFEIDLQLVDRHGDALLLHETSSRAPPEWFPDDIDPTIRSPRFDVSGVTLPEIRGWIETLNRSDG